MNKPERTLTPPHIGRIRKWSRAKWILHSLVFVQHLFDAFPVVAENCQIPDHFGRDLRFRALSKRCFCLEKFPLVVRQKFLAIVIA